MQETIKNINIDLLIPFENHPFKKRDGIESEELKPLYESSYHYYSGFST